MSNEKLRELLEQLHNELDQTESVDERGDELLRHLNRDISNLLERSRLETRESMLERLQDTIDHFEVTHPTLTKTLSEMMTILSNAGI